VFPARNSRSKDFDAMVMHLAFEPYGRGAAS